MTWFSRVPLAWKNLSHRPVRFAVYLAGIAFAVLLMFVQLGFWGALLDSVVSLIERIEADVMIINRAKYALPISVPFPMRRLEQARSVSGVRGVAPLYVRNGVWRAPNPLASPEPSEARRPREQLIRVVACNIPTEILDLPEVAAYAQALREPGTALIDMQSKPSFGVRPGEFDTDLNSRPIRVLGTFHLGTDFATNGTLIMGEESFAEFFQTPLTDPLNAVDIGLVFLESGADPDAVRTALAGALPDDVLVLTREEYISRERNYWQKSTPIGFVFSLGLVVGFVVGVTICSQILSTDVNDHLGEYATLKAIGYTNAYLTGVVLQEALLLSVIGFIPGLLLSKLVYVVLASLTRLPLDMTFPRGATILGFTMLMCVISGMLAVGKVWVVDPAEVF